MTLLFAQQPKRRYESRTRMKQTRHRVRSKTRRWGAGMLLLVTLLSIAVYYYLTRPARLVSFAESYLSEVVRGRVEIEDAHFSVFGGLHLKNVNLFIRSERYGDRPVFSCASLILKHDPLSVFTGKLEASDIVATAAHFRLVADPGSGKLNVSELAVKRMPGDRAPRRALPRVHLPNVRFSFHKLHEGRSELQLQRRLDMWAFQRRPGVPIYQIAWRDRDAREGPGQAKLNMVTGSMAFEPGSPPPWLPVEFALAAIPVNDKDVERWRRLLGIGGNFRVEDLAIGSADGSLRARGRIELKDASLSVPIDVEEERMKAEQRFFAFTEVSGSVEVTSSRLKADFEGNLRGRSCQAQLEIAALPRSTDSLTDAAWDLSINCPDFQLLRDDPEQYAPEARLIRRWKLLGRIYEEYDPHGKVHLSCKISKAQGREAVPKLRRAMLKPLGADITYEKFPYRINDITGKMEVTEEGRFLLHGLTGRHGPCIVNMQGIIEGHGPGSGVDLRIEGRNGRLDDDLRDALPQRYHKAWDLFSPAGHTDVNVHLTKQPGAPDVDAKMKVAVEGTLTDAKAAYTHFPYPIEHLKGRYQIEDGFTFEVAGEQNASRITISGSVSGRSEQPALDIKIRGANVPIDQRLRQALPEARRRLFDQFLIQGRFDLDGAVVRTERMDSPSYRFDVSLDDNVLTYKRLPYALSNCEGVLRIRPQSIILTGFKGKHGDAEVEARAEFGFQGEEHTLEVNLAAEDVQLDDDFWRSLPEGVRRTRDQLNPGGQIAVESSYHEKRVAEEVSSTHKTTITAKKNRIVLDAFPLPLRDVSGQVVVEGNEAKLMDISARHEDAIFKLSGRVVYEPDDTRSELQLSATQLSFNPELRLALPSPLQSMWDALRPAGTLGVHLDQLTTQHRRGQPVRWELAGMLKFSGMSLGAGPSPEDISGEMRIRGDCSGDSDASLIRGELSLETAELVRARLTGVKGWCVYDGSSQVVAVSDLKADAYGGTVRGSIIMDLSGQEPQFDAVCELRDIQLQPLLKDRVARRQEHLDELQGLLNGLFSLHGPMGATSGRHGWAHLRVTEAQLYKLPILLSILNVINLTIPEKGAFQEGEFRCVIDGNRMRIDQFALQGTALDLSGDGSMTLDDQSLDLYLVVDSPRKGLKIPLLTDVLDTASRELIEVRVQGELVDPRISTRPLGGLRRLFRSIFRPKVE